MVMARLGYGVRLLGRDCLAQTCAGRSVERSVIRWRSMTSEVRPASSQLFSVEQVQAGISALAAAGYDTETVWEQRVVWGDHDQFQHVNNVHFVRWFESARMWFANQLCQTPEFSDQRRQEINRGTGKSFILAGINVRYRKPVLYPDTVSWRFHLGLFLNPVIMLTTLHTQILIGQACQLPLAKDRFILRAAAYSLAQQTIVAVSAQDCVTYDYTKLAKCDIPDDIRKALESRATHFDKKL